MKTFSVYVHETVHISAGFLSESAVERIETVVAKELVKPLKDGTKLEDIEAKVNRAIHKAAKYLNDDAIDILEMAVMKILNKVSVHLRRRATKSNKCGDCSHYERCRVKYDKYKNEKACRNFKEKKE
jgi:hypothetical protein